MQCHHGFSCDPETQTCPLSQSLTLISLLLKHLPRLPIAYRINYLIMNSERTHNQHGACSQLKRLSGSWAQTSVSPPLTHPCVPTGPKRLLLALGEAPTEEMTQFHPQESVK